MDCLIIASRSNSITIRRPGKGRYTYPMARIDTHLISCQGIPDMNFGILGPYGEVTYTRNSCQYLETEILLQEIIKQATCRCKTAAVRRPGYRRDGSSDMKTFIILPQPMPPVLIVPFSRERIPNVSRRVALASP